MKKRIILLLTIACGIFLTTCETNRPVITTIIPTNTMWPTVALIKTPSPTQFARTLYPEETLTTTKETSTPTTLPQEIPIEQMHFQCIKIVSSFPDETLSSGILVLESREKTSDQRYKPETFLLNMATRQTVLIAKPSESQIYHTVSPDRKILAYFSFIFNAEREVIQGNLVIATASGQQVKIIQIEKGWAGPLHWLNNETLVFPITGLDLEADAAKKAGPLLALNPFLNEQHILKPDFPGIYTLPPVPYWNGLSLRIYDPEFTRAAYLRITEKHELALAIWSLQKQQILANLSPYGVSMPRWSPDGSRLVTNAPVEGQGAEELFLINRDGKIEQLTNLNVYATNGSFLDYSWSPDGNYIAAWILKETPWDAEEVEFVIIDLNTKQMTNYCIKVKYGDQKGYTAIPPAPFWSPDATQLVLYDWDELDHSRIILLDRVQGYAAQIAKDREPTGWMLEP